VRGNSFEEAVNKLFGVEAPPEPPPDGTGGGGGGPRGGTTDEQLIEIIDEADGLYTQAQDALQEGDLETYARLIEQVGTLLEEARSLQSQPAG